MRLNFFSFYLFFLLQNLHSFRAIIKCACESKKESGCKEMWKYPRDIWRMNHFQVWEHLSPWAGDAETRRDFSLCPSCFQSENILQCRPECWESDDLRESKWQSDSVELERRRQRKMRNGGGWWGVVLCTEWCCQLSWSCVVSFLKEWAAGIYIVRTGNARNICNIPLSTSDGVCGGAESRRYIWQLKESWRTDCTNDLTLPFQPVKTSCFGRRHTLSVRLICFPGV